MPDITLYELGPTRSARCRWTLLEAELEYESVGNAPEIIGSEALKQVHPLGKLPAAVIDGKPLFESAAIATAIADMVPERGLIAPSGTWERALHDQWVSFALTEMEPYVWSTELNTSEYGLPEAEQIPAIVPQNKMFYLKAASVMDAALAEADYLVANRFSVTDIIVSYTVLWGTEEKWLGDHRNLLAYLDRLRAREHCPLRTYD